jgi:hypothetical protein
MGPDVTLASCSALPLTDASSGSSRPSERRAVRARSIRRGRPHSCSHSKETPVLSAHSGSDLNEIRDLLIPPLPIRRRSDLSSCAPGIRCSPHDPRWLWSQRDGEEEGTTFQGRPMDNVAIALALLDERPFEEIRRPDEASMRDWQFQVGDARLEVLEAGERARQEVGVIGADSRRQLAHDRPRRRLIAGGGARLELRPEVGRDLGCEVTHSVGQAAPAHESQNRRPTIITAVSSRCHRAVRRGRPRRSSRANNGPNFRTHRRSVSYEMSRPRSASRFFTSRQLSAKRTHSQIACRIISVGNGWWANEMVMCHPTC